MNLNINFDNNNLREEIKAAVDAVKVTLEENRKKNEGKKIGRIGTVISLSPKSFKIVKSICISEGYAKIDGLIVSFNDKNLVIF